MYQAREGFREFHSSFPFPCRLKSQSGLIFFVNMFLGIIMMYCYSIVTLTILCIFLMFIYIIVVRLHFLLFKIWSFYLLIKVKNSSPEFQSRLHVRLHVKTWCSLYNIILFLVAHSATQYISLSVRSSVHSFVRHTFQHTN